MRKVSGAELREMEPALSTDYGSAIVLDDQSRAVSPGRIGQVLAKKVQQHIEQILGAATVKGLRSGDNPARWKANLEHVLPKVKKETSHHESLPVEELPQFMGTFQG